MSDGAISPAEPNVCPMPIELVSQRHKITHLLSPIDLGRSLARREATP